MESGNEDMQYRTDRPSGEFIKRAEILAPIYDILDRLENLTPN